MVRSSALSVLVESFVVEFVEGARRNLASSWLLFFVCGKVVHALESMRFSFFFFLRVTRRGASI